MSTAGPYGKDRGSGLGTIVKDISNKCYLLELIKSTCSHSDGPPSLLEDPIKTQTPL